MSQTYRRLLLYCAIAGALIFLMSKQLHTVKDSLATFRQLKWPWVLLAVAAEAGSMGSFATSQQWLLKAGATRPRLRSVLAVTYASNALSVTLPFAGPGVGAAFTFRQLKRRGLEPAVIGWALTLSGIISSLTFVILLTIGALLSGNLKVIIIGLSGAAVTALPVAGALAAMRWPGARHRIERMIVAVFAVSRRLFHYPDAGVDAMLRQSLERIAALRATRKEYLLSLFFAWRNWTTDCTCLIASILACGSAVPWHGIVLAYCMTVAARGVGLTPGGVGVVEIALTGVLVASGIPPHLALAAALVYRGISFWLVTIAGWIIMQRLTSKRRNVLQAARGV